jgi:hypothetical protein
MSNKAKHATCYLMFAAMSEIMLSMYENTYLIAHYDKNLETKLKNLKVNFERTTAREFKRFQGDEQLVFMKMITIFENLIESSINPKKFQELVSLIDSWEKDELTVINSKEELVKVADQVIIEKSEIV